MNAYPVLDLCKGNRSFYSLTLIDRLTARTKSLAGVRLAAFDRCPLSRRGSRDRGRGRLYLAVAGVRLAAFDRCPLNGLRSRDRGRGRLYLAVAGVRLAAFDRCPLNGLRSRF